MKAAPARRLSRYDAIAPFTLRYGAYRLKIVFVSRKQFTRDKRGLRPALLAEHFMRVCIRLIHHVNGLSDDAARSEESFTHSLANGLVSLAHRSPQAWVWFNALLSEHVTSWASFQRVLISDHVHVRGMPKRLNFGRHVVTLHWWPKRLAVRHQEWGFFDYANNRIHLSRDTSRSSRCTKSCMPSTITAAARQETVAASCVSRRAH